MHPTMHSLISALCFTALCLIVAVNAKRYIVPGARWYDTDGALISCHAGGITREVGTDRFFWFGERKVEGQVEGGDVSVYSSSDLVNWQNEGLALAPIEGHWIISPQHIIQRPKVVYSVSTGLYNLWWHADNSTYGLLLQGLATSPNISGPYTFQSAIAPLNDSSQDFGLFVDGKDDEAYALYSNGDSAKGRDNVISKLNEDRTNLTEVVYTFRYYDLEAPTIIQTDEFYYIVMSHKTGYRPNNVVAFRSRSLSGPWSQPFTIAPLGTRTYNSQSGFSLKVGKTSLYFGDQWDSNSLWESRYIWLPTAIDDDKGTLDLVWRDVYELDIQTGEYTSPEGTTYYAKDATIQGGAFKQEANFASGSTIATGIYGNDSTLLFEGIEGSGQPQWVSFYYQNTDDAGFGDQPGGSPDRIGGSWALRRIASVIVNGNTNNLETLHQRDTNKGVILSTPLELTLEEGSKNTIEIGGLWNGVDYKGADIDKIVVYAP